MLRFKRLLRFALWFVYGFFAFWSYVGFLSHFTKRPKWVVDASGWIYSRVEGAPKSLEVYMGFVRAAIHLTVIAAVVALACLFIKRSLPPEKSAVILGKLYKYGMWFSTAFIVFMLSYYIYFFYLV
jgi:hypothetical protein